MKRTFILVVGMAIVLVCSMQAHAALQNLGTDSLGNRLIYDTDLDITWYDYTHSYDPNIGRADWDYHKNWAENELSVTFGSNVYTDWRMPTTVDGTYVWGYDGSTTAGFNITSSEMGHLFYTELGNEGYLDTSGNTTGCSVSYPFCLTNTGPFQNLLSGGYWSGTEVSDDNDPSVNNYAWYFGTGDGSQGKEAKGVGGNALAVRPGLAVVPEPISSILFVVGGATLGFRRFWKKRKTV